MASKRGLPNTKEATAKKFKSNGHWSLGLLDAMKDPHNVVKETETLVVIKDKYPKAEFHYLVIPKENISSLKKVGKEHTELLHDMHEIAVEISKNEEHSGRTFKIGYHAEASMVRLHLHAISDDMNSSALKTKKHWNSFTTSFFMKSEDVCKKLKEEGTVVLPNAETTKKLLNTPLKCHKCEYTPKHIPDLKKHILTHIK